MSWTAIQHSKSHVDAWHTTAISVGNLIYILEHSAARYVGYSVIRKSKLSTIPIYSYVFPNVFNARPTPPLRREPFPRPSTSTSPHRYISDYPYYRRGCHWPCHRLGSPRSRLPCYRPCFTLGLLHRRATSHISNRRRPVRVSPSSLRSAH